MDTFRRGGEGGYEPGGTNVGVNPQTGAIQLEIKGLAEPKSPEAARICREDLNELITTFVQDTPTIERGMFDKELPPEELGQAAPRCEPPLPNHVGLVHRIAIV